MYVLERVKRAEPKLQRKGYACPNDIADILLSLVFGSLSLRYTKRNTMFFFYVERVRFRNTWSVTG